MQNAAQKVEKHSFNSKKVYMEFGKVKTYANKTQADKKVNELRGLGFNVGRSISWPFLVLLQTT